MRALLERKVAERLGSSAAGADDVKRASFFSSLDFELVNTKEYTPEFRPPQAKSETDVGNFDPEFTSEVPADSLVTTHMSETMQEKSNFQDFTFQGDDRLK